MKLNVKALALTSGLLWGGAVCLATLWLLVRGHDGALIRQLDHFYIGYSFSYAGALVGLVDASTGPSARQVFAWLYDKLSAADPALESFCFALGDTAPAAERQAGPRRRRHAACSAATAGSVRSSLRIRAKPSAIDAPRAAHAYHTHSGPAASHSRVASSGPNVVAVANARLVALVLPHRRRIRAQRRERQQHRQGQDLAEGPRPPRRARRTVPCGRTGSARSRARAGARRPRPPAPEHSASGRASAASRPRR